MKKIGVVGGGAWGTALAQCLAQNGKDVLIWAREGEVVQSINNTHENTMFLAGLKLHSNIRATNTMTDLSQSDAVLIVTPAQHMRTTMAALKSALKETVPLVICAKGVEIETGALLSVIAAESFPKSPIAILTGPTFAAEIGRGLPSAVTLAMKDSEAAKELAGELSSKNLRMYPSDDIIGAQIGGAVKNVIAIACGIIEGKKLGDSARAALVTRGLAEIARLGSALGAKKETLMGMCGVGDLILTCSSMQSRNFSLGVALGQGRKLSDILAERNSVTEGVHTAKAMVVMAKNHAVDMPVCEAVHHCLTQDVDIGQLVEKMLDRPLKSERA